MPAVPATPPTWIAALLLAPAAAVVIGAVAAPSARGIDAAWRRARSATVAMAVLAVAAIALRVVLGERAGELVRLDTPTVVMLTLIALVAWTVTRFSESYLGGDPGQRRYIRRLLSTIGAVAVVVVTNNVVVLVVAWASASVALHGLLTFYGDRPVAVAVAHKKFLLARCADVCMVGATVAFVTAYDTLRIDRIANAAAASLTPAARVGVLLVVLAALLKCAQLPFHGWLIQVMEAPTPVSALLHAGVVNLGGFVLLRFAPAIDAATEARTILVITGTATAVAASLVMTTRVSVKVALAWSTCAQMGFMLVQCGLGLWEMALLHLVAHSVYKAYAFLAAGDTVRQTQRGRLLAATAPVTLRSLTITSAVAVGIIVAVGGGWSALVHPLSTEVWLLLMIVALAIVAVIPPSLSAGTVFIRAALIPLTYLVLHDVADSMVPDGAAAPHALLAITAGGFIALFILQALITIRHDGVVTRIRPWIYAGLFLDDAFTRAAYRLSPPPPTAAARTVLPRPFAVVADPFARVEQLQPVS